MIYARTTCRLCESSALEEVLHLAATPPANAFVKDKATQQPYYPLKLMLCHRCGHVQLSHVVGGEELFEDYVYVSGTSPSFVRHFADYARALQPYLRDSYGTEPFVVEIGSNDGTMLKQFEPYCQVLGVDPAKKIAQAATEELIETLPYFFTKKLAKEIVDDYGRADLVIANNVMAHIDDLNDVVEGVRELLAPGGVFVFEVQYLKDLVDQGLFDMIYHEHLDYHALRPLDRFFQKHRMRIVRVDHVPTHGGSVRVHVKEEKHAGGCVDPHALFVAESPAYFAPKTFHALQRKIDGAGEDLHLLLRTLTKGGRTIAGFGAPAKATTLMHEFEIGDALEFIVDDNPMKQGLYSPGHHIPVKPTEALYEENPDYCLILAWNFAAPIMEKHRRFTDEGGFFIVPLPALDVKPE